jgi:hypothetical protein
LSWTWLWTFFWILNETFLLVVVQQVLEQLVKQNEIFWHKSVLAWNETLIEHGSVPSKHEDWPPPNPTLSHKPGAILDLLRPYFFLKKL